MKYVTPAFLQELKKFGKQLDLQVSFFYDGQSFILNNEDINSLVIEYKGSLLKSVMKSVTIDCNFNLFNILQKEITIELGLLVNGSYEYINYGNFVITEVNKKEDTSSFEGVGYDKLIYAMKPYEQLTINYPCTVETFINQLATKLGFTVNTSNCANLQQIINTDVFQNIGFTYRDVLDDLAEVTGTTIYLTDNTLNFGIPRNSGAPIDEESLKDVNVNFGEKYRSC